MHHLSRPLAVLTVIGITASILPVASFAFSDASDSPHAEAIAALEADGILEGYADGTFRPDHTINRAEFLKIVLASRGDVPSDGADCFPDVTTQWFAPYVCAALEQGVVAGYPDGTFRPAAVISFVEAAKMLTNAYEQPMELSSPDWYEPFARALESSKAIPPSIRRLDQPLTRGEMAEMMWRLRDGRTDRPTKGYLNVKYPETRINFASDEPQIAATCADLEVFAAEAARSQQTFFYDKAEPLAAPAAEGAVNRATGADDAYSQTNVQVAGVDEADSVKTDGENVYMISDGNVRIVRASPPQRMQLQSTIAFPDGQFSPSNLYIERDVLTVIGTRFEGGGGPVRIMDGGARSMIWPGWGSSKSEVRLYDVSDPANPILRRTVGFDGSVVSTRRMEDRLFVIAHRPLHTAGTPVPLRAAAAEDLLPQIEDSALGTRAAASCGDVMILPRIPSPQYLTVAVIPLRDPRAAIQSDVVLGSAEHVYASPAHLYVAHTDWRYDWSTNDEASAGPRTSVYRFVIKSDGVALAARGEVPGRILNQFSMDEHGEQFRIATTTEARWTRNGEQTPSSNHLYILNHALNRQGAVEDIAPGERIYSVRFMGNRAYMVTFRQIDPLYAIDTSDAKNPRILGSLKIPGYSDYLHPYSDTLLLGFGKDAVADAKNDAAWAQGMKIALFDVSNVARPMELHATVIGDRGTESPLLQDHHALLFDRERNLLAFPVQVHALSEEQRTSNDPSAYGSPVFQGAYVYSVTPEDGFTLRGTISHVPKDAPAKAGDRWYDLYGKSIRRILRIGDSLLTVSDAEVRSHAERTLQQEGSVVFPPDDGIEDRVY